jgi:hypothetical protein
VKRTVSAEEAVVMQEPVLPERVQEALGELAGAAKEGLLALSVGVGLGVLQSLMVELRAEPDSTAHRQWLGERPLHQRRATRQPGSARRTVLR